MSYGFPAFSPIVHEHHSPCVILPDPTSDDTPSHKCNAPSGLHTALDWPICDDCWSFIRLEDS